VELTISDHAQWPRKEIAELRPSSYPHSIHAKGYEERTKKVEKLKKENENLRITVMSIVQTRKSRKLKMLATWDKSY